MSSRMSPGATDPGSPPPASATLNAPLVGAHVTMTSDVDGVIAGLSRELGVSRGEVLLRAIGLLKAAQDARREGKAVGAVGNANALDTEFTGF